MGGSNEHRYIYANEDHHHLPPNPDIERVTYNNKRRKQKGGLTGAEKSASGVNSQRMARRTVCSGRVFVLRAYIQAAAFRDLLPTVAAYCTGYKFSVKVGIWYSFNKLNIIAFIERL